MEMITYQKDSMGYLYLNASDKSKLTAVGFGSIKGSNFLTPNIIGFVLLPNGYIEISKARERNPLANYGATVVIEGKIYSDLSSCFMEYEELKKHVDSILRLTDEI